MASPATCGQRSLNITKDRNWSVQMTESSSKWVSFRFYGHPLNAPRCEAVAKGLCVSISKNRNQLSNVAFLSFFEKRNGGSHRANDRPVDIN